MTILRCNMEPVIVPPPRAVPPYRRTAYFNASVLVKDCSVVTAVREGSAYLYQQATCKQDAF
jgi:hypothetical protein